MRQQGVVCGMVISRIVGRGLSQVKGGIPVRKSLYGTGQDSATCVGRIKKRSFLHWKWGCHWVGSFQIGYSCSVMVVLSSFIGSGLTRSGLAAAGWQERGLLEQQHFNKRRRRWHQSDSIRLVVWQ